jgi:transcription elongation factor Elf1
MTKTKYGQLTVQKQVGQDKHGNRLFVCKCTCGEARVVTANHLNTGRVTSCKSCGRTRSIKAQITHGMSKHPLYEVWSGMKDRCEYVHSFRYDRYGGRGIKVCPEWTNSFETFYKDMGERPVNTTLDRIDNNGDYCKANCRWVTRWQQNRNKSDNVFYVYKGESLVIADWATKVGIKKETLLVRIKICKWSIEKALTTPVKHRKSNASP